MTQFVFVRTEEGCMVCRNISETSETITVEVDGYIIKDIPKDIVSDYV